MPKPAQLPPLNLEELFSKSLADWVSSSPFMCRVYPASLSMDEENGCRNVNNATIFTHLETQSVSVLPNMSN